MSLEEAVAGKEIKMKIPTLVSCTDCNGTGAKDGTAFTTCPQCGGSGQVRMSQGFFSIQQTCPKCSGRGKIITEICNTCNGNGRYEKIKNLSVKIPPGVDTGDTVRLSGEGEAGGPGAAPGDLYVSINLKPHEIFSRDGNNLRCEVPINLTTAILGEKVIIPTLDGKVELKIPKGTQSGKIFRIKDKGVKSIRSSSNGDLYCRVHVETPINLTSEQERLIRQLDESLTGDNKNHRPKEKTWMDSIKDFFE